MNTVIPDDILADAIVEVLDAIEEPLDEPEIVKWLATSGLNVEPKKVRQLLESILAPGVRRRPDGRWMLEITQFDDQQLDVINAPPQARLLVYAGPGAGKTEVACARVARLIENGTPASSMLVVSFTRAATAEIRERIQRHTSLKSRVSTRAVEVRTLDSLAWTLQFRLSREEMINRTYSDNIAGAISMLANPPDALKDYLDSISLLVIDESQDLVGHRAILAGTLVKSLPMESGVLILADPAQAIYGDWALDEGEHSIDTPPFPQTVEQGEFGEFQVCSLHGLHRTDDEKLIQISQDLRATVLAAENAPEDSYREFRIALQQLLGKEKFNQGQLEALASRKVEQFFLFRTHGEAVRVSSYLSSGNVPHRLRFPGLPRPVYPWIGRLFSEYTERRISRVTFSELWRLRLEGTDLCPEDPDRAWELLFRIAPADSIRPVIDTYYLREILSRANPPDDVCTPTLGNSGPVLGTIHGSKGREAEEVTLVLSSGKIRDDADYAEETRVLYVGATRARQSLTVAEMTSNQGYLNSRRAWSWVRGKKDAKQIEFGLEGDVDRLSPVSKAMFSDRQAIELQDTLCSPDVYDVLNPVKWIAEPHSGEWFRVLRAESSERPIGFCGDNFVRDLWDIANSTGSNRVPPNSQMHLYVVDLTTVARPRESPDLNSVTRTFAESGFWVAPLIKGFSIVYPGYRRWKGNG